jgi:hypothetical protein
MFRYCLNNVQFYFGNEINIIFGLDQSLFFHLHITFNMRYAIGLELSAVT